MKNEETVANIILTALIEMGCLVLICSVTLWVFTLGL